MTSVDDRVEYLIRNYPGLCENRTQALYLLLCRSGNGYEWQSGELVPLFEEREHADSEVQVNAAWIDDLPDDDNARELRKQYAADNAHRLDTRSRAAELARTAGYLDRLLSGDQSIDPLPLPVDATAEWVAAWDEYRRTARRHPEARRVGVNGFMHLLVGDGRVRVYDDKAVAQRRHGELNRQGRYVTLHSAAVRAYLEQAGELAMAGGLIVLDCRPGTGNEAA